MSAGPSPFAAWFDVPEHADLQLSIFTHAPEPCTHQDSGAGPHEASGSSEAAARYHFHAVVLSAQSGYFKAQLSHSWQQTRGTGGGSSSSSSTPCSSAWARRTVDVHVEAEELDAMHELLRMMYSQALPAAAAPTDPLLLQCLTLADRFEAVSCIELLTAALAAVPSEQLDCRVVSHLFQAAPGVCISRSYPALLASCARALVCMFGDVPAVIKDERLMQRFRALPHAAVLAWAASDELRVHSENCVVFLVSAWAQANPGSTPDELEQLAHQIRVFHVGPTYQHHILPNLAWFKHCRGMEHLPSVVSCIRAGITMKEGRAMEKRIAHGLGCPPQWMAKPRLCSVSSQTGNWTMCLRQLKAVDGGEELFLPSPLYVNGFMMSVLVAQERPETSAAMPTPGQTMGVYYGVDIPAMSQHGVPCPDHVILSTGPVNVKVGGPGSQMRKEGNNTEAIVLALESFLGASDFLGAAAPTFLELVAPYLEEGQLHIEATFTAVDAVVGA